MHWNPVMIDSYVPGRVRISAQSQVFARLPDGATGGTASCDAPGTTLQVVDSGGKLPRSFSRSAVRRGQGVALAANGRIVIRLTGLRHASATECRAGFRERPQS
jgi:hypothetical protein